MELRLYTFCNMYLSSIQQGVQSLHVLGELNNKYPPNLVHSDCGITRGGSVRKLDYTTRLQDWQRNHKTVIVLNGGCGRDILDMFTLIDTEHMSYSFPAPYAYFCEDEKSLGGVMTAVGIVLPVNIFDAVSFKKALELGYNVSPVDAMSYFFQDEEKLHEYHPGSADHRFISKLKSCGLAR